MRPHALPGAPTLRGRGERWVAGSALLLIVAADYPFRMRDPEATLSGAVDLQIAFEVGAYAVVGAFLLSRLRLTAVGRPRPPAVWLCCFVGAMLVAALHSDVPHLAAVRAGQFAVGLLLVFAIDRRATTHHMHVVAHGFVGLVAVSIVAGLVLPTTKGPLQEGRFNWFAVHPVSAGVYLAVGVAILTAYVLDRRLRDERRWPSRAYLVLLVMFWVALVATHTRAAVGSALIASAIVAVLSSPRGRRGGLVAVIVLAGTLVLLLGSSALVSFLERGQTASELTTLNTRTHIWTRAWDLVADSPLFGHGIGTGREAFLDEFGLGNSHNAFVETAVDAGLVGGVALAGLVVTVVTSSLRLASRRRRGGRHRDGVLLVGLCAVLVVNSVTTDGLGWAADLQSIWLFTIVGWILIAARDGSPGQGELEGSWSHVAGIAGSTAAGLPEEGREGFLRA